MSETANDKEIRIIVYNTLTDLGIPCHLKGFHYINYILIHQLKDDTFLDRGLVKVVYSETAEEFNTSSTHVERCIRSAIEYVFKNSSPDVLHHYFGNTQSIEKGKLTNSAFLHTLSTYLKVHNM